VLNESRPLLPYSNGQALPVQTFKEEGWKDASGADKRAKLAKGWVPIPLRAWFWIPLVIMMFLLVIGLEIALHKSNVNSGWASSAAMAAAPDSAFANYYHYAYTQPPVIVAMAIVALWAWIDIEILIMQPYIDLAHGNASAKKSILLDYTRSRCAHLLSLSASLLLMFIPSLPSSWCGLTLSLIVIMWLLLLHFSPSLHLSLNLFARPCLLSRIPGGVLIVSLRSIQKSTTY